MSSDRASVLALLEKHAGDQPPADRAGVAEWLDRLCRALSAEACVDAAAITLGNPADGATVVAASPPGGAVAETEFGVGEGPGHDAWSKGRPVLVPDLGGSRDGSWPGFSAAASTAGVQAVFAFPLQVGAAQVGVLTVFRERPGALTGRELHLCLTMAELASERLIDGTLSGAEVLPSVDGALDVRSEVYQAQGMVAVALGIGLVDALARIRAEAFRSDRTLIEVASDIVNNGPRLDDDGQHRHPTDDPYAGG